jgi:hypothetical protein
MPMINLPYGVGHHRYLCTRAKYLSIAATSTNYRSLFLIDYSIKFFVMYNILYWLQQGQEFTNRNELGELDSKGFGRREGSGCFSLLRCALVWRVKPWRTFSITPLSVL